MGITGIWYNELGSQMELFIDGQNNITGLYMTKVGYAEGTYHLIGQADLSTNPLPKQGLSISFVVCWINEHFNSHASTGWVGQLHFADTEDETITTTWLLTNETTPDQNWHSTLVGQDIFTRKQPSQEEILRNLSLKPCAFPHSLHQDAL